MEIVFKILCGILYCIGLLFGCDYKEISVYICIYGCPIICILTTLLINSVISNKLYTNISVSKLFYLVVSYLYTSLYLVFFAKVCQHYNSNINTLHTLFDQCVYDFQRIALHCSTTYEHCNIIIYVYLLLAIVCINSLISYLLYKYLK